MMRVFRRLSVRLKAYGHGEDGDGGQYVYTWDGTTVTYNGI